MLSLGVWLVVRERQQGNNDIMLCWCLLTLTGPTGSGSGDTQSEVHTLGSDRDRTRSRSKLVSEVGSQSSVLLPSDVISYLRNYEVTKSCDIYCMRFCSAAKRYRDIPTL